VAEANLGHDVSGIQFVDLGGQSLIYGLFLRVVRDDDWQTRVPGGCCEGDFRRGVSSIVVETSRPPQGNRILVCSSMLIIRTDCFDADHLGNRRFPYRCLVLSSLRRQRLVKKRTHRPADMEQLSPDAQIGRTQRRVLQASRSSQSFGRFRQCRTSRKIRA
jgi:hypothetical protein